METKDFFSPTILEGKVSLLTGAGRGLGKVMAQGLAHAGSALILIARHEEEIDRTAKEIQSPGKKALVIKTDVTQSDDISRMVEKAMSEFGKIDVLINNAGQNASYVHHKFEDIPETEWISMIQTNVTGVFLVSQIVGRTMLAQGSGKIINIASSMGVRSAPERICYSVSKAAVIQMTRTLAVEWAPRGITVNCIAPGSLDLYPGSMDEKYLKLNEERKKRIPLGRLGRLDEVGFLLIYLASDASDYMTGETIFIDGGMAVG
jgi:NAD(P)-dependent dehydrogenase (short-subunit alcohol dehydrogenase family)